MVDKNKILGLLSHYFETTGDVSVDNEGLITCTGHVSINGHFKVFQLPVRFKHTGGYFFCADNSLKSLVGAPQTVGDHFWCQNNQLEQLEGGPKRVRGDFTCQDNLLKSLEGAPNSVGGSFLCHRNPLESLEGLPSLIPGVLALTWHKDLPLLRCLVAEKGVSLQWKQEQQKDAQAVAEILNKYKGQPGDRFSCQKDLIDAGFPGNARW